MLIPKNCNNPTCSKTHTNNHGYCDDHARQRDKRQNSSKRGYGSNWQKVRRLHLLENPFCVECEKVNRECSTTHRLEVHHIDENPENNESENLKTLCRGHHDILHGRLHEKNN